MAAENMVETPVATPGAALDARYQALLVGLLSLNFGILFFDRNALSFLMPFVQPDLSLSNTQVGLTSSSLSLSWALAALFVSAAADRSGRRKAYLLGATVAFSLCSFLTGIATSFLILLGTRLLMGFAEGGVNPISQSITALAVRPERRGLAMGLMQNFGSNLLGSFAAPVLLVGIASAWGWRRAFFLAGIPGLVSALLLWRFVREPGAGTSRGALVTEPLAQRFQQIFRHRNMVLCALISILLVSYLVICWSFVPLFLTQVRGLAAGSMSWLMGTLGLSATVGSFVVTGISDRIGRRPVMIFTAYLGVILPLGALYYGGSTLILAAIFFFGWALTGSVSAVHGNDSVRKRQCPAHDHRDGSRDMHGRSVRRRAFPGARGLGSRSCRPRRGSVDHVRPVHRRRHSGVRPGRDRAGAPQGPSASSA